jgi:hypothetical protein
MRYPLPDGRGSERCCQSRAREQADLFYSIRITMLAELNSRSQLRNPGFNIFHLPFSVKKEKNRDATHFPIGNKVASPFLS